MANVTTGSWIFFQFLRFCFESWDAMQILGVRTELCVTEGGTG